MSSEAVKSKFTSDGNNYQNDATTKKSLMLNHQLCNTPEMMGKRNWPYGEAVTKQISLPI